MSEIPEKVGTEVTEPLHRLLLQLLQACLHTVFDHVPIAIIDRVITCCALVALVTPLLLWISWSKTGFFIILGTASSCVAIIWLLIWLYPEDPY